MPTAIALRHLAFEDLGLLGPLLANRGFDTRYWEAPTEPIDHSALLKTDLLVVLGGPIGVYEENDYPFLSQELAVLKERLRADRPTLGICLGAQLMARSLGANVYPSGIKEIGWAAIDLTEAGEQSALRHLHRDHTEVLHWHGDTFDLPSDAVHLASTAQCRHQAFSIGRNGLALQFHAEAAGQDLERWFVGHTLEISQTDGIDVPTLRAATQANHAIGPQGSQFFSEWLDSVGFGPCK